MQVLMDTGPWVALIDRSESRHRDCVEWLKEFSGEIFSTEAVLTEVLYLLSFSSGVQLAALDFVLKGAIVIAPSSLESLKMAGRLMKKYEDLPMDYADASLVCLAHDLNVRHVVTFDKKHFAIYRLPKRRSFVILP